ncbi:MAG: alpha/beta hydrolase, partial [Acidobacteriota bacterium]
ELEMSKQAKQVEIAARTHDVRIPAGIVILDGQLNIPKAANGIVLFGHGFSNTRLNSYSQYIAETIRRGANIGTLLFDLFIDKEKAEPLNNQRSFDTTLLAERLIDVTSWVANDDKTSHLPIGYFDTNTDGAALIAAAELGLRISAIVSCGGWSNLVGIPILEQVKAPTLFIVAEYDAPSLKMNLEAYKWLQCEKELKIIPGAINLFEKPETLKKVAQLTVEWFQQYYR